ncbi:probable bifunctional dTTP/UTP pyrophosphatase/methyltransferase protein [Rhopilema esculentum]|uniref:probable bifunctional dTTP/UTP pyrophosphatase/methyltransferase protein n=1 Tax=Rhopilema esculentum TaxID=499914 RepID=UPI0031D20A80
MLQPTLDGLSKFRLILASGSPRRKEILANANLKMEIVPSTFEENLDKSQFAHPSDYVKENSKQKAIEVFNRLNSGTKCPDLVVGADTVVVLGDTILEKPKSSENAFTMLKSLGGLKHEVYSGITFLWPRKASSDFLIKQFHECTRVEFGELTDDVIIEYVKTGEPLDKAGGYGIQGLGGTLVKSIEGDYYNVVGFPLYSFCKELKLWYSNYSMETSS